MNRKFDEENVLILADEDGSEIKFEIADVIEEDKNCYAVLYPITKGINEYVIVEYTGQDNGEDMFELVYDTNIIDSVFKKFKCRNK